MKSSNSACPGQKRRSVPSVSAGTGDATFDRLFTMHRGRASCSDRNRPNFASKRETGSSTGSSHSISHVESPAASSLVAAERTRLQLQHIQLHREMDDVNEWLQDARAHADLFDELDSQLAEVAKTRSLIAACCTRRSHEDPCSSISSPAMNSSQMVKQSKQNTKRVSNRSITSGTSVPGCLNASEDTKATSSSQPFPESEVQGSQSGVDPSSSTCNQARVIELRSFPCGPGYLGTDCACCLAPLAVHESVLAFPCVAKHVFHARCLLQWFQKAGERTTCPLCRSWPRGGYKSNVTGASPRSSRVGTFG